MNHEAVEFLVRDGGGKFSGVFGNKLADPRVRGSGLLHLQQLILNQLRLEWFALRPTNQTPKSPLLVIRVFGPAPGGAADSAT